MPYKNLEKRKTYHKKYSREWEKRTRRWFRPERKKYRKDRYISGSGMKWQRFFNYGITQEQYDEMLKKQNNRCSLCGRKERRKHYKTGKRQNLSVDHDHKTNKVRGLLCRDCNVGLGMFEDTVALLLKAIKYLNSHKRN